MTQSQPLLPVCVLFALFSTWLLTTVQAAPNEHPKDQITESKGDPQIWKIEGWQLPRPPYPYVARAHHEQGSMVVEIITGKNGKVVEASVPKSKTHPTLDSSTANWAFANWSGPPYHRTKVPVTYRIN